MKAIETVYGGKRFRSRLEARWAVFFDTLGVPYVYEPEGYDFGTHKYLPDFWLPDSEQFFEVKGIMTDIDREKIESLVKKSGHDVVIGLPNMEFEIVWLFQDDSKTLDDHVFWAERNDGEGTSIFRCSNCGCVYFASDYMSWACPKCGTWKGRDHLIGHGNDCLFGDELAKRAAENAMSARFEFGEKPA